jgi:hypothetical protein
MGIDPELRLKATPLMPVFPVEPPPMADPTRLASAT